MRAVQNVSLLNFSIKADKFSLMAVINVTFVSRLSQNGYNTSSIFIGKFYNALE
jgi:hypothetical protein